VKARILACCLGAISVVLCTNDIGTQREVGVQLNVNIIERSSGRVVSGEIRPALAGDKVLWSHWHGLMPRDAEDARWEWDKLMDLAHAMPEQFAVYSLVAEGELQGLRMLEVSEDDVEAYGVHALRLSTAPWNRPPEPRFRGVGSVLVGSAIVRSLRDGRNGLAHCESLPRAEPFHEKNGMVVFDDLSPDGLRRYRFTEESAWNFLMRLRQEGLISWSI
jgi:hypothetical protein